MKAARLIKHALYAHEHNKWHPHLLRLPALVMISSALLLVNVALNKPNGRVLGQKSSVDATEIIQLINNEREIAGLLPLTTDGALEAAASAKAADMLARDYWSHSGPDGEAPWIFIEQQRYVYQIAGENLARGFLTSRGLVAGWMASAPHRDNLLNERFIEAGIAAVPGDLDGEHTTLVVAFFALPQSVGVVLPATDFSSSFAAADADTNFAISNPLPLNSTLSTGYKITIPVLIGLAALYINQHIVIKRRKVTWNWHPHRHPLVLATALAGIALLLVASSFGVVL